MIPEKKNRNITLRYYYWCKCRVFDRKLLFFKRYYTSIKNLLSCFLLQIKYLIDIEDRKNTMKETNHNNTRIQTK